MAKVLIVRAHPLNQRVSRSMKVTDAFVQSYKEHHPDDIIEDINLYNMNVPEIDGDLLDAWDELGKGTPFHRLSNAQQHKVTLFNSFTADFLEQDKIVIANPLWNLSVPTRLKSWFDTVTVAGKTFKYTDSGSVGLVEGKKLLHIQANGGFYNGSDPASQYVKTLFTFLGITDFHQLFVEGMDHAPDKANEIVEKAVQKAAEIAKTF
ncbi:NAD(P)H-dependent oxidoreductase [Neobacillus sp. OS1-32]|jgi:FMN-dependent NADH-azoreductase|uniref:FMN dependent NADH:quinone oxidoreductase n=1 Tax=Neobacillus paridis TaxID=2803862 RepID=A0ABS1TJ44_9BACI|nr:MULTISPECIES: NAD(P)H-dependent oxidoreductase [Neobacillus]MBL4951282.1 NAD(P)H-dependent oxidoreductase [Neobacillus paridis]WML30598.1 NAD(P)H-dependent oxidoreductase [Neobacillus sp. OS1-32]